MTPSLRSGLDLASLDRSVRPQDDLFSFVNGGWVAAHEIPADRGRYGTFDILREQAEQDVRAIVEEVAATSAGSAPGSVARSVGDLYGSFMDEDAVEAAGLTPIRAELAAAGAVATPSDVLALLGRWLRIGVSGLIHPYVSSDNADPDATILYLEQGGISLPDESYYREAAHEAARTAYPDHVARMLALAKYPDPQGSAAAVMALETRLAGGHWDNVTTRDPVKTYNRRSLAELEQESPGLDWTAYARGLGHPEVFAEVVVRQPEFLTVAAAALAEEPIQTWRAWLTWRLVHDLAPYLSSALVEENFDFFGRRLSGVPQLRARWKRGVALVEEAMGEAVGQLYVERHFPPRAKERMSDLVDNLVEAFRRSFTDLAWMSQETREQALTKLAAFVPKIGYPEVWRDYSSLRTTPGDLVGNVAAASAFEIDRMFGKLGAPVDRTEWFMTPQTVNAYYHPGLNEIVFPAAILQPPFFDVDADDAVNYGGIGAVIGHEIGHGFDDQGSQFDGAGALRNWWTEADRAAFDARAQALIEQFSALESRDAPGMPVNGALTVGENIGDLGGLTIGYSAYRISLEEGEAPVLDSFTGDQRFFLGWAQVWRGMSRREEAERLLTVDPHAPIDVRANAVRNLDEFHAAFGVREGDGLWVDPQDRVRIF
ncbi:MAG: peptidase M13 [Tetrasphaera sp.]|nr:peptidase M13 [Tetrasphaera sp.]